MPDVTLHARGIAACLGGRPILRGIDLDARTGELLAILGPNGAGKSTLLRALAGLVPCDGEVVVAGAPLRALSPTERARRLGYVPQHSGLEAPLLVQEVVAQGRYAYARGLAELSAGDRRVVDEAIGSVDIDRLRLRRFTELSHGERRLVLLARALATGAPVVLLDEPSAGLDVAHALSLFHLLRRLCAGGKTMLVVLHHLDEALHWADRALLIAQGETVASGPTRAVLSAGPVRRAYGVELVEGGGLGYRLCPP